MGFCQAFIRLLSGFCQDFVRPLSFLFSEFCVVSVRCTFKNYFCRVRSKGPPDLIRSDLRSLILEA